MYGTSNRVSCFDGSTGLAGWAVRCLFDDINGMSVVPVLFEYGFFTGVLRAS